MTMNRWPLILVIVLLATLGVLATAPVRWINVVNAAQEQRLRGELEGAARRFNEDVDRELLLPIASFKTRQAEAALNRDPKLIASIRTVTNSSLLFGFDADALTMVMPIGGERSREFVIVQFDAAELTQHVIPEAAQRSFAGFDVAIARGDSIVYRSNP